MWIDSDPTREGVILGQLYDEADDEDKVLVKKHFLTTICHGDVWTGAAVDDTADGLMRRLKVTKDDVFEQQRKQLVLHGKEFIVRCIEVVFRRVVRDSFELIYNVIGPSSHVVCTVMLDTAEK